jgi:peptidoglycan/xylan/chitin deacetylase (PgdA/CDA1 family)
MAGHFTAFLMYHELGLPGRNPCAREPGYTRYVVPVSNFRDQMHQLARSGWQGISVSQALQSWVDNAVCITFDDGCQTDLISAAPVLEEASFSATFYVTAGLLGKPGYLSESELRSLRALGFEIGCHSLTHAYLTDIDPLRLREETKKAKDCIEQIIGAPVDHFSCPGGRWNRTVVRALKDAGFHTMATSRTGLNASRTNPFALSRIAVLCDTPAANVVRYCRGQGLLHTRFQEKVRSAVKLVLGNSIYDNLRRVILERQQNSESRAK